MVIQPKKVVGEIHHQTKTGWNIWCFDQRICLGVNHQAWIPNLEVSWWFHWLRGGLKNIWFDHEWSQEGSSASPTWAEFFYIHGWDWMENSGWSALLIHVHSHLIHFMAVFWNNECIKNLHFLQENHWLLKYQKRLGSDLMPPSDMMEILSIGPGHQKCMARYVCLLVWLCSMDWFKGKFTGNHRFSH